jgi:YD repeat-containing protein
VVWKKDRDNLETGYGYDVLGRLIVVTNAYGTTLATETHYDYDERGNLLQISDANTHVTRFGYDSLGRRTWRRLPGGQVEHWDYDTIWNGQELLNVQIHRDFENYPTRMEYDVMGRLAAKIPQTRTSPPDTRPAELKVEVHFTYYSDGQRKKVTVGSAVTCYAYDEFGRLKVKATPQGQLTYEYGDVFDRNKWRLGSIRTDQVHTFDGQGNYVNGGTTSRPQGQYMQYWYDSAGLLHRVGTDMECAAVTYEYEGARLKHLDQGDQFSNPNALRATLEHNNGLSQSALVRPGRLSAMVPTQLPLHFGIRLQDSRWAHEASRLRHRPGGLT